jgi:glycosyltransferase involved in cell wall biosynthesis
MIVARLMGKPVVLTLHTAGQDEPQAVRRRGYLSYYAFRSADIVLCVSPQLTARCREARLADNRVHLTPNGVDTTRFRPASLDERLALRKALGLVETEPLVLFVGFFSRDKRPDLLFRAWRRVVVSGIRARLVYVGAKGAGYFEIDESLAAEIQAGAAELLYPDGVTFINPTNQIEQYFRAADLFVLPSAREAHPLALLEAMACGLPSIATRLPGATDVLIEDGVNGRLVPPDDEGALVSAIRQALVEPASAWAMGARARDTITAHYDIRSTADRWATAYEGVRVRSR